MAFFASGGQPKCAGAFIQGCLARTSIALTALCWLSACGDIHNTGPEAWWHEAVGGKIAQQRPPPPGDKDPYPNLATVPPKPPAPDTANWHRITAGLITDRVAAHQAAAVAPIPAPSVAPPVASPKAPATREPGASAALVGASAPAAPGAGPKTPPTPGPPSATASASKAPASAASAPFAEPKGPIPPVPRVSPSAEAQRVANGRLPPLPQQEPARPGIAPPPPPPAVPLAATPPVPSAPTGTDVDFDRGSTKLNDAALAEVKSLAERRGDLGVAITGFGDATSSDPLVQSDAVSLGLSRAQALASALVARGVPFARLRLDAESAGRGATMRLLE